MLSGISCLVQFAVTTCIRWSCHMIWSARSLLQSGRKADLYPSIVFLKESLLVWHQSANFWEDQWTSCELGLEKFWIFLVQACNTTQWKGARTLFYACLIHSPSSQSSACVLTTIAVLTYTVFITSISLHFLHDLTGKSADQVCRARWRNQHYRAFIKKNHAWTQSILNSVCIQLFQVTACHEQLLFEIPPPVSSTPIILLWLSYYKHWDNSRWHYWLCSVFHRNDVWVVYSCILQAMYVARIFY